MTTKDTILVPLSDLPRPSVESETGGYNGEPMTFPLYVPKDEFAKTMVAFSHAAAAAAVRLRRIGRSSLWFERDVVTFTLTALRHSLAHGQIKHLRDRRRHLDRLIAQTYREKR